MTTSPLMLMNLVLSLTFNLAALTYVDKYLFPSKRNNNLWPDFNYFMKMGEDVAFSMRFDEKTYEKIRKEERGNEKTSTKFVLNCVSLTKSNRVEYIQANSNEVE